MIDLTRIRLVSFHSGGSMDFEQSDDLTNNESRPAPSIPTPEQEALRRRYGLAFLIYVALALFAVALGVYNLTTGSSGLSGATAFIDLALAVLFALLASWVLVRRRRLQNFVSSGVADVPRHLRRWQNAAILIVTLPLLFLVLSRVVGVLFGPSAMLEPIGGDEKQQQIADFRSQLLFDLNTQLGTSQQMCENLQDLKAVDVLRESAEDIIRVPVGDLSVEEARQVLVETYLTYCGLDG